MSDYAELVKNLREEAHLLCDYVSKAKYHRPGKKEQIGLAMRQAADAIEELVASVEGYKASTDVQFIEHGHYTEMKFIPKWIPVTERLPLYGDWVLGIGPKKGYHVCEYRGITHFPYSGDIPRFSAKGRSLTITHWMPLPTPPKEET